jgi:SagB-type dehydrogenase family enzyme
VSIASEPLQALRAAPDAQAAGVVRAYHERSKHRLQRYAAGPETLDWEQQPDPFRRYADAPLEALPLPAQALAATGRPAWGDLFVAGAVAPRAASRSAIGLLFELSFALSAWKQHGPDRWAVRCNPSSGNLHPTEAYLLVHGIGGVDDGLEDGLYHYAPREHALERRAAGVPGLAGGRAQLWLGLSSIHWREAWKYGERAFRYCQLDVGHALGALRYAAAVLGWRARVIEGLDRAGLAALMGLDRDADFGCAEREEPELLVELLPGMPSSPPVPPPGWLASTRWHGQANRLDRNPMYRWPVIEEVAAATRSPALTRPRAADELLQPVAPPNKPAAAAVAVDLIRQRRSAQRFDPQAVMPRAAFARLVLALRPRGLPWDVRPGAARLHLLLFAHRVEGLAPGTYMLPRSGQGEALMRQSFAADLPWQAVEGLQEPLFLLADNPALAGSLRTLNCHQALGSDAMLAFALVAEFDAALGEAPSHYRELLQEAGLTGQVLYLEAEAAGLRGTGIGCFFDDALHQLVGLQGTALQSLYHFTIGAPLDDPRIASAPPYPERATAHHG